jgi:hypothetical protein
MLEAFEEIESFAEMAEPPKTWAEAMKAVVAGVVDHDEIGELVLDGAKQADKLLRERMERANIQMFAPLNPWADQVAPFVDELVSHFQGGEPLPLRAAAFFHSLGEVADQFEAIEAAIEKEWLEG